MALSAKSLFLYNYQITAFNSSIDFRTVSMGPILQATLRLGFYSLSSLSREISRALTAADPSNEFVVTADRNILAGLENRVTIECTSSPYLDLLFLTGPRAASSVCSLIGFLQLDKTGSTSYTGSFTSGTIMIPTLVGYNYLADQFHQKQFGTVNVSASGIKEAIVFQTQRFIHVKFKYEPKAKVLSDWFPFMQWASRQRLFEFTPEITDPNTFYEVTVETTSADGKGLAFKFSEMLPEFPNHYDCGELMMRVNEV